VDKVLNELRFSEPRLLKMLSVQRMNEIKQMIEIERESRVDHFETIIEPMRIAARHEIGEYFRKNVKKS
jgi:hypothetical protein